MRWSALLLCLVLSLPVSALSFEEAWERAQESAPVVREYWRQQGRTDEDQALKQPYLPTVSLSSQSGRFQITPEGEIRRPQPGADLGLTWRGEGGWTANLSLGMNYDGQGLGVRPGATFSQSLWAQSPKNPTPPSQGWEDLLAELKLTLLEAYHQAYVAQIRLDWAGEDWGRAQESVELARLQFAQGLGGEKALWDAQLEALRMEQEVLRAQRTARDRFRELEKLVGGGLGVLGPHLPPTEIQPPSLEQLSLAYPELRAAQTQYEAVAAEPTPSPVTGNLQGGVNLQGIYVELRLEFPVANTTQRQREHLEAQRRLEDAARRVDEAQVEARAWAQGVLQGIEESHLRLKRAELLLTVAQETLAGVEQQVELGLISSERLKQAQRDHLSAKLEWTEARISLWVAITRSQILVR